MIINSSETFYSCQFYVPDPIWMWLLYGIMSHVPQSRKLESWGSCRYTYFTVWKSDHHFLVSLSSLIPISFIHTSFRILFRTVLHTTIVRGLFKTTDVELCLSHLLNPRRCYEISKTPSNALVSKVGIWKKAEFPASSNFRCREEKSKQTNKRQLKMQNAKNKLWFKEQNS